MTQFEQALQRYKALVNEFIFANLPSGHEIPEIGSLYEMMKDYPSRIGKGLRPSILLIFCRAFGGSEEKAINTAAALELFQNWIVIHDDIEDGSELRRGQPALHVKYGIPLALNAGDALAGKMWEFLANNRKVIGDQRALDVIEQFLHMYNETTAGQHIELSWVKNRRWDLTRQDYFNMCRRKTAWYTCITPAWTGALIAGADGKHRETIFKFGTEVGVAFQIQDDVLNLAGDEKKYGKEILGDLWEGKRTLITIDLMEKASPEEKRFLTRTLDMPRHEKSGTDINEMMKMIRRYGSIESAIKTSVELATNARAIFADIEKDIDRQQCVIINEMTEFMINRTF